jgi:hypothetical protein
MDQNLGLFEHIHKQNEFSVSFYLENVLTSNGEMQWINLVKHESIASEMVMIEQDQQFLLIVDKQ